MHYLISGANGFIGSNLAKRFPKRNVIAIPHQDLYNYQKIRSYIPDDKDLFIFHCAAYGNMAHQVDPDPIIRANIIATQNMLTATRNVNYKAFVYLSSSSVYGIKNHPMHETNSLEARDFYGITKMCAELLIRAFVHKFDKPIVIARPFSVYGPREADFRFIPTIIKCIKHSQPMNLAHGMHDWIYIDDFIDGLMYLMENASNLRGKAVNVGTGVQYDNYEVVQELCQLAGVTLDSLPITHVANIRSVDCWVADNTLLRSLGWAFTHSLREGLKKTYEHYE